VFPRRLWGQKKFFNACSGLPTYGSNYLKILEFQNQLPLDSMPTWVEANFLLILQDLN
jgi:hypothetical protein